MLATAFAAPAKPTHATAGSALTTSRRPAVCQKNGLTDGLAAGPARTINAREHLFCEGDRATHVYQVEAGHVCISRMLADGRRQVVDFAYPGDIIGLGALDTHATSAQATTKTRVRCIPTATLHDVAPGVDIRVASGITGDGVEELRRYAADNATIALLGASGVGKSTLVNALVGHWRMITAEVREGDQRGRHTTTASELIRLVEGGWLVDTPGLRAVSLWSSGRGIERAFADVFELMDLCRFRNCKHDEEPDCAVNAAVADGRLDPKRLDSMKRLVAEEAALEAEQRAQEKALDKRGVRKPRPTSGRS